jgi:hypothetical protein
MSPAITAEEIAAKIYADAGHAREYEEYLKQRFGLERKKQKRAEARDRLFSRLHYEGSKSYQETWQECGDRTITKEAVRQAIIRNQKAREQDVWAIRSSIFVTNFPLIPKPRL